MKENHGTVTGIVEMKEIIPSDAIIDDTYKNRPERVYTEYAPTLRSEREGLKVIKIRQATKDGFVECELPGIADLNYTSSTTRRGRVQEGGEDNSNDNNGEYP